MEVGAKLLDVEACNEINRSSEGDSCFLEIAIKKNDSQTCEKIIDSELKTYCLAITNSDLNLCKSISSSSTWRDTCILNLALKEKDISICDEVSSNNYKDACKEVIAKK